MFILLDQASALLWKPCYVSSVQPAAMAALFCSRKVAPVQGWEGGRPVTLTLLP